MKEPVKNILKLIFVGMATTVVRIIGQLSIPAGEQTVLAPSAFAQKGTMPIAFTIYGIFAYSPDRRAVPAHTKKDGRKPYLAGLRYGLVCCAVWIVYLWEPLPHVTPLDRITYPVADGLTLLFMGLLLGWLFGQTRPPVKKRCPKAARPSCAYHNPLLYSRAVVFVLRCRYLFVLLPKKPPRLCYGACWQVL